MSSNRKRGQVHAACAAVVVLVATVLFVPSVLARLGNRVHEFRPGETVEAAKMNDNFDAVLDEVDGLDTRMTQVEGHTTADGLVARIAQLEARLGQAEQALGASPQGCMLKKQCPSHMVDGGESLILSGDQNQCRVWGTLGSNHWQHLWWCHARVCCTE